MGGALHSGGARGVVAFDEFEVVAAIIVITDHREAISADREGSIQTDDVGARERASGYRDTRCVVAFDEFEVVAGIVVVGNHRVTVGADGDRGVLAGGACAVERALGR